MRSTNSIRYLLTLFMVVSLAGCTTLWNRGVQLPDRETETVATDFVSALALLRGHSPINTTVQVRPPKTAFGRSLVEELRRTGYGLQTIPENDTGPMLVTYEADSYENSDHRSVAYRIRVGNVEMGREYELRNGNVFPITSLSVKGVQIASQPLDQNIFERAHESNTSPNQRIRVAKGSSSNSVLMDVPLADSSEWQTIGSDNSVGVNSSRIEVIPTPAPITIVPTAPQLDTRLTPNENILLLGKSNHESVFQQYTDHKTGVVVFPNDSLHMGIDAKEKAKLILSGYNKNTDIVSVIGCSHGQTTYQGGNRELALGRARRVMDELQIIGVPKENIYDEGCWAAITQKELPARGVIVILKRKTRSS